MPTAKVTKNVSAATGGGNVLCSTLISIKTKAWLYFFHREFVYFYFPAVVAWQTVFVSPAAFVGLTVASYSLLG